MNAAITANRAIDARIRMGSNASEAARIEIECNRITSHLDRSSDSNSYFTPFDGSQFPFIFRM